MKTEKHHNQPTNDKLINHINKQSNNHTNNPLLLDSACRLFCKLPSIHALSNLVFYAQYGYIMAITNTKNILGKLHSLSLCVVPRNGLVNWRTT